MPNYATQHHFWVKCADRDCFCHQVGQALHTIAYKTLLADVQLVSLALGAKLASLAESLGASTGWPTPSLAVMCGLAQVGRPQELLPFHHCAILMPHQPRHWSSLTT